MTVGHSLTIAVVNCLSFLEPATSLLGSGLNNASLRCSIRLLAAPGGCVWMSGLLVPCPRGRPPAAPRLQLFLQPDRQTFIFPFAIDVCTGRKQLIATVRINCARKELSWLELQCIMSRQCFSYFSYFLLFRLRMEIISRGWKLLSRDI